MALALFRSTAAKSEKQLQNNRKVHVGRGGFTAEGILLGFGKNLDPVWVKDSNPVILLVNLDGIAVDGSRIKQVEGVSVADMLEVQADVNVYKTPLETIEEYCAQHIAECIAGQYRGDFPVEKFYDADAKKLRTKVQDYIQHGDLVSCKMWNNNVTANLRVGDLVQVTGCNANRCLFIPKARGAAATKEKAEAALAENERLKREADARLAAQVAQAASANDALDEIQVAADGTVNVTDAAPATAGNDTGSGANGAASSKGKIREPSMFDVSFSCNGSCTLSPNNGEGTLLDKLRQYFPHNAHTLRLPADKFDSYTAVVHLSPFQHRPEQLDNMEPGPSVARDVGIPVGEKDYEKPPAGQKAEDTATREMCMKRFVDQAQYVADFTEEMQEGTCAPFQAELSFYENHVRQLGITRLDEWRYFGPFPWQGIVVALCNASGTLSNSINQPGEAIKYNKSGLIETWTKVYAPDVPMTALKHMVEVDGSFVESLYADVWRSAKNKRGQEVVILALNELASRQGVARDNPAHVNGSSSPFVNLNEWNGDAGKFAREYRIFVLPFVPVDSTKTTEFERTIRSQKDNGEEPSLVEVRELIYAHQQQTIDTLRNMSLQDRCDMLLGRASSEDIYLFTPQEIAAMENLESDVVAPVLRCEKQLPGQTPRSGFRMLVYAISQEACDAAMDRWRQEEPEWADAYQRQRDEDWSLSPQEGDNDQDVEEEAVEEEEEPQEMEQEEEEEPEPEPEPVAAAPPKPAAKRGGAKPTVTAKPRAKPAAKPRPSSKTGKPRARK